MASDEHKKLSLFIKSIHSSLRNKAKEIGSDLAWKEHCKDEENLKKYASSMKSLATIHWCSNAKSNLKVISRISWVHAFCKEYFNGPLLLKHRLKEIDILNKLEIEYDVNAFNEFGNQLQLLDVGSCYNPFKIYEGFNVLAIDIAPACDDVFKCDFINVSVDANFVYESNRIQQLQVEYYDVIVFSLLLEYLPSPEQRLLACEKAYSLLKTEGILIIITPDSKHVGANSKFMKSWRFVLSKIGFSRIKYEKLPYLHCMAFRKSFNSFISQRWAKLHETCKLFDKLNIPQDFKEEIQTITIPITHEENIINYLLELPFCIGE